MQERFSVYLTPIPTSSRVARQRRTLRWRWGSFALSTLILAVILIWFRPDWPVLWLVLGSVLWVGSSVFWLVVSLISLSNAKKDLARIPAGIAFHIDPEGLSFVWPNEVAVAWQQIERLPVVGGRGGAGPRLAVVSGGQRVVEVPFSFLDASPAVLDSMLQACSLGKHHLDATKLERAV